MQIQENSKNHFDRIGGEAVILQLVTRFYDIMEQSPQTIEILELHPKDLRGARTKLYEFLVGWMGGPPVYVEKYGHPRLRMRHIHVAIGALERDQWMYCINTAMQELAIKSPLQEELQQAFYQIADFMRNKEG